MHVICFGDSNTWGYDPRSWLSDRYEADSRWVDILAAKTGWAVRNQGQNGRTIPRTAPVFPKDIDLLIVMLGTNDLLQGRTPQDTAERMEHLLTGINLARKKLLLIAPAPVTFGTWVQEQRLIDRSHAFAQCCRVLAEQLGIPFANAGDWDIPLSYDGVHFTAQGHRAFAAGLLEVFK